MSIIINPEDDSLFLVTGEYERCVFCHNETKYWNDETNNPVCTKCAKKYNQSDLEKLYK